MLKDNLKPKRSACAAGGEEAHALLCKRPYHNKVAEQMQNKTQPLPKNLIHYSDSKEKDLPPYGLQQSEMSQQYRPKVGNRQVEIAPLSLPGEPKHEDPGNQDRTVLTEITSDPGDNPSNLSTQRSPEQVSEDYEFGRLLGEGAYAVVRTAKKKGTG